MRSLNFESEKPLLYLVPTPIGNLDEFSPRALEVINNADIIAAEDTRVSGKLLRFFNICKQIICLREHNEVEQSNYLIEQILSGKKVVYMSDAGYPCISDPGAKLVTIALKNDINVSCISGPNAALNALVASGINPIHFYFHGFLDAKDSLRDKELTKLKDKEETLIFYESPHRINKTLKAMSQILGDRNACLARELTKKHEEYIRDTLLNLSALDEETLKGEMVIIVEGKKDEDKDNIDEKTIIEMVNNEIKNGSSAKDAIKIVSLKTKINKNIIYNVYHK